MEVELQVPLPRPCIAIRSFDVSLFISRDLLVALAQHPDPAGHDADDDRLARSRYAGARAMLAGAASTPDCDGHFPLGNAELGGARYLLAELLENGLAGAQVDGQAEPVARIQVNYHGDRAGPTAGRGMMTFSAELRVGVPPSSIWQPFLVLDWWVA